MHVCAHACMSMCVYTRACVRVIYGRNHANIILYVQCNLQSLQILRTHDNQDVYQSWQSFITLAISDKLLYITWHKLQALATE